jgi:hypothetical protein
MSGFFAFSCQQLYLLKLFCVNGIGLPFGETILTGDNCFGEKDQIPAAIILNIFVRNLNI